MEDLPTDPPIVVHPVHGGTRPYRRVDIAHQSVGHAYSVADVIEFARRAGLENFDPYDADLVSWRVEGPEEWGEPAPE